MEVTLYSDGSSRGNPGPGGYGTILRYTAPSGAVHEKEFSAGFSCTTNNRMELLGCIVGLEALKRPCTVTVYSDSQYLVNAFNQNWVAGWLKRGWKNSQKQPVKNVDLWKRLLAAKEPVSYTHLDVYKRQYPPYERKLSAEGWSCRQARLLSVHNRYLRGHASLR